jgi:hypothetical protein
MTTVSIISGTTTANVVTDIVFPTWYQGIEIVNRGSSDMWARADGVDPTIAGANCIYIPSQSYVDFSNPKVVTAPADGVTSNTEIRLITGSACAYTVSGGL